MNEQQLITQLLSGDEEAFRGLVRRHQAAMIRVAKAILSNESSAEEVVQETWLVVIRGLKDFQQRSTLRTWIYGILANIAKKRAGRDGKMEVWDSLTNPATADDGLLGKFKSNGHWSSQPQEWKINPEVSAERKQLLNAIQKGIDALPHHQRLIMILSDVEGMSGPEVCSVLDLKQSNQRVLLHRARSAVRIHVDGILGGQS